ncbi:hypothetical protein AKO1_011773 [Acrasis kona]|uniref:Aspartyl/asparaginy/proline hydroxylase domain-containing protein n=1 Tax=Acrasis kona TaxID=1008807 RepID=A0AAW2Z8A7_9EUKA
MDFEGLSQEQSDRLEYLFKNAPKRLEDTVNRLMEQGRVRGTNKMQQPTLFVYPEITSKPWHDVADYPWASILEQNSEIIKREFMAVARDTNHFDEIKSSITRGKWTSFYLYNQGRRVDENCDRCPNTMRLIEDTLGPALAKNTGISYVYFSVISPSTHITPHCGVCNLRLRFQLPIISPANTCTLKVGEETRTYEEGKSFIFDDSFYHSVKHLGDENSYDRVVLLIDFWHPELSRLEVEATEILLPFV